MQPIRVNHRIRAVLMSSDRYFVEFVHTHANLIMAIAAFCLAAWGVIYNHPLFIAGLAIAGAVSYFIGIVVALLVSVLAIFLEMYLFQIGHEFHMAVVLVESFGYICIAWLGYRHRIQKQMQELRLQATDKPNQVMPWVMVNEVRTSLAAIRFLLFPLHEDTKSQELQQATRELSRLEGIFREMENEQNNDAAKRQHR